MVEIWVFSTVQNNFVLQHPIRNLSSYLKAHTAHSGKTREALCAMAYTVAAFFTVFLHNGLGLEKPRPNIKAVM